MKKKFFAVVCVIALVLGLFLVACQKQESGTEAGGYGEEKATESGGYGEEEKPAETGGYGAEETTGGYGE